MIANAVQRASAGEGLCCSPLQAAVLLVMWELAIKAIANSATDKAGADWCGTASLWTASPLCDETRTWCVSCGLEGRVILPPALAIDRQQSSLKRQQQLQRLVKSKAQSTYIYISPNYKLKPNIFNNESGIRSPQCFMLVR